MKPPLYIGIDPGINTGIAIKTATKTDLKTVKIHVAFMTILNLSNDYQITVICEDSRLRKWFGSNANMKQQGAGAAKIQCTIWNDFLEDMKKTGRIFDFKMVHPIKNGTKINEHIFKQISGCTGRTSEHARDAYMLIHNKI